jgi:hypothetical protein
MKKHTSRGLRARDFEAHHYMLCFNPEVFDGLTRIKNALRSLEEEQHQQEQKKNDGAGNAWQTKIKTDVVLLEGSAWFRSDKHTHALEINEVVANVKDAVKGFLEREMGWVRPSGTGMDTGPNRTLQRVLPKAYREKLTQGGKWTGSEREKEFKAKTGCTLWFTWDGDAGSQLVSLTGPKGRLKEAEAWVKALESA